MQAGTVSNHMAVEGQCFAIHSEQPIQVKGVGKIMLRGAICRLSNTISEKGSGWKEIYVQSVPTECGQLALGLEGKCVKAQFKMEELLKTTPKADVKKRRPDDSEPQPSADPDEMDES